MVSKASEDLPEPERPVKTTSRSRGMSRSMFLRLCSRAPRIAITRRSRRPGPLSSLLPCSSAPKLSVIAKQSRSRRGGPCQVIERAGTPNVVRTRPLCQCCRACYPSRNRLRWGGIVPEPSHSPPPSLAVHLLRFASEQNKNTYGAWAREAWARKHVENAEEAGCRLVCRDPPALGCRKRGFGGGGAGKRYSAGRPHSAGKCHGRKRQQSDPGWQP